VAKASAPAGPPAGAASDPGSYNADASMRDAAGRQALIDAAVGAARGKPDPLSAPAA
jgi:hypothetical protein